MSNPRLFLVCIVVMSLAGTGCFRKVGPSPSVPPAGDPDPAPTPSEQPPAEPPRTVESPAASPTVEPVADPAVPPPPGIRHPLERGQTLAALSKIYGVPVETLMSANRITDPTSIPAGTPIFVPGATKLKRVTPPAPKPQALFSWPLTGRITSPFGPSAKRRHHAGIDIDGEAGDPIRAAAAGRVLRVADHVQYGRLVVIEHDNGYTTWYGHASTLMVWRGDEVTEGQVIARVGESGNARGSHLHFEVRRNGRPVNPLPLLK